MFPAARRRSLAPWLVAAAVLGCALAARGLRVAQARWTSPTGAAEWIWIPTSRGERYPVAFFALRDFALDAPPAAARLALIADEEYVLTLNARRVGAGGWGPGRPLDVYEVAPLLRAGGNRLEIELRSSRGIGGLLLELTEAGGRPILVSDRSWRLARRDDPGWLRGWRPFSMAGEPVASWGLPPLGRWGKPQPGPLRPLWDVEVTGSPIEGWDQEVVGYLELRLTPTDELRSALLFFDDAERGVPVIVPAGARSWLDSQPRRFRSLRLVGLSGEFKTRVLPVAPQTLARLARPRREEGPGVMGLAAPRLRTPVEDEVGRKLQGVAGVAGRKEL
jgi:hypothetical protein